MRGRELRIAEGPIRVEKSRTVDTEREINLTESEVIAANLAALGASTDTRNSEDRVFDASVELHRKLGRTPTSGEIARHLGNLSSTSVCATMSRLANCGRMLRVQMNGTRVAYIPKVV